MPSVHFETTCDDNFWLAVEFDDLPAGDKSVDWELPSGKHTLHWHFAGNPGDTITVEITCDGADLGKVDKRPIPEDEFSAGATKTFTVP